jgi:hypothetical protein
VVFGGDMLTKVFRRRVSSGKISGEVANSHICATRL